MLVLTRKRGEQIEIAGQIRVTVVGVQGNRVRLGIDAPDHVSIRRGEIVFDLDHDSEIEISGLFEEPLACI